MRERDSKLGRNGYFTQLALCLVLWLVAGWGQAKEIIPPAPPRYFNDFAGVVSPQVATELNRELEGFEKRTSNQILVAVFPSMQSDSSLEDYAQRIYDAWKPGAKDRDNGAIFLVFLKERRMRIQTGYGLEGALPDALCKRIIEETVAPRFRANDLNGGMRAGVHAILQAAQGEYTGTGRTVAQQQNRGEGSSWLVPLLLFGLFLLIQFSRARGTSYQSGGRRIYTPWNSGFGGGGGGGGGGWGGGGFSGGGGRSGGGGASGGW